MQTVLVAWPILHGFCLLSCYHIASTITHEEIWATGHQYLHADDVTSGSNQSISMREHWDWEGAIWRTTWIKVDFFVTSWNSILRQSWAVDNRNFDAYRSWSFGDLPWIVVDYVTSGTRDRKAKYFMWLKIHSIYE